MAPIRRRKKEPADQALTCLDALRLLDISRGAPALTGNGPAGNAEATMPPPPQQVEVETSKLPSPPREVKVEAEPETPKLPSPPPPQEEEKEAESEMSKHIFLLHVSSSSPPQQVEVELDPETSKLPSPPPPPPREVQVEPEPETPKQPSPPPPPPREVEVEAEPETPKQPSPPPPPQEDEEEAESEMSKHIKAVLKAMLAMGGLPDYDERYDSYLDDFFRAYIQAPRPVDPPWLPDAAGLGPIKGRYPYLAGEMARIADADTAEQREALGAGLLREVDAAELAALDGAFHEATWAGKRAMLAKLEAEVQYARARIDAEAMIEMLGAADKASSSV